MRDSIVTECFSRVKAMLQIGCSMFVPRKGIFALAKYFCLSCKVKSIMCRGRGENLKECIVKYIDKQRVACASRKPAAEL